MKLRQLLIVCTAFVLFSLIAVTVLMAQKASPPPPPKDLPGSYWVYVGNYAKADKKGIYLFRLDAATGSLTPAESAHATGIAAATESPNFLAVHPTGKFLYAVTTTKVGDNPGAVEAYAIDAATGKLTFLNRRSSGGAEPVHIAIDPTGKVAAVANYTGGSVALLPIGPDGQLGEATAIVKHTGSSIDPDRQKKPFPHGVAFDATGKHLYVADLGTDKIVAYTVDAEKGTLTADAAANGTVTPGSGARHLALSKDGRFLYAVSEMGNTVDVFSVGANGELKTVQTISPWTDAVKGKAWGAEAAVGANGHFLYACDRGNDSLAVMAMDAETGKLNVLQNVPAGGGPPRHFAIDPTGSYLMAENQKSNSLVMFQINAEKGTLRPTGIKVETPSPVCAVFVAVK